MREIMGRLDHQFMNDLEPFGPSIRRPKIWPNIFMTKSPVCCQSLPPGARVTDVDHLGNGHQPARSISPAQKLEALMNRSVRIRHDSRVAGHVWEYVLIHVISDYAPGYPALMIP